MSADDQTSGERMLAMTDAAYDKVMGFLLQEAEPERQAMWLEVTGTSANQWTCSMALKPLDAAAPYDAVVRHRDLAIVVPERDFDKVRGATIDWLDDPFGGGGLRVDNPNTPSPAIGAPPPADLSGDVPQRVIQVLEQQVNPTIAAHGGARRARGGRAGNRLPQAGWRLSGLRDGHRHAQPGDRDGHHPGRAGDHERGGRDRPPERHEPLLRGRQEVGAANAPARLPAAAHGPSPGAGLDRDRPLPPPQGPRLRHRR